MFDLLITDHTFLQFKCMLCASAFVSLNFEKKYENVYRIKIIMII